MISGHQIFFGKKYGLKGKIQKIYENQIKNLEIFRNTVPGFVQKVYSMKLSGYESRSEDDDEYRPRTPAIQSQSGEEVMITRGHVVPPNPKLSAMALEAWMKDDDE